jgi:hypothetical protein
MILLSNRWRLLHLIFIGHLSSCSFLIQLDENTYPEIMAKEQCRLYKKCWRGYFDDEFTDIEDCIDEITDNIEDAVDSMDDLDCDFEDDEAEQCLVAHQEATCEDHFELHYEYDGPLADDCDEVWDCD